MSVEQSIITSDDRDVLEFVAHLLMQNGKLHNSLVLYEALLKLDGTNIRAVLASCYLLIQLNRADAALPRLEWLAANGAGEHTEALTMLRARALLAIGRADEARRLVENPAAATEAHAW